MASNFSRQKIEKFPNAISIACGYSRFKREKIILCSETSDFACNTTYLSDLITIDVDNVVIASDYLVVVVSCLAYVS
jgi:hypothetical protein